MAELTYELDLIIMAQIMGTCRMEERGQERTQTHITTMAAEFVRRLLAWSWVLEI